MDLAIQEYSSNMTVADVVKKEALQGFELAHIESIESECVLIDQQIYAIKRGALEIGRSLSNILRILKDAAPNGHLKNTFEKIIRNRFDKSAAWGYKLINVYDQFKDTEPSLIENYSTEVLYELSKLSGSEVEVVIRDLNSGATSISAAKARELVKAIMSQRSTQNSIQELQELLDQANEKQRNLQNKLDKKTLETERLQRDLEIRESNNEEMLGKLRELQSESSNVMIAMQKEREEKAALLVQMENIKKKTHSESVTVEVPVIPSGFSSIQDAIDDVEARLSEKQKHLSEIEEQVQRLQKTLNDSAETTTLLTDLHNEVSKLAIRKLEIINKSSSADLSANAALINKISEITRALGDDLLRYVA